MHFKMYLNKYGGDKTTWSLEQQYEYAHFEIEIGLSDQTVAALPTAEDLSVDEARRLVQEKLYANLQKKKMRPSLTLATIMKAYISGDIPI